MRLLPILRWLGLSLLLAAGGSASAFAQAGYPQRAQYGYAQPPQQGYRDLRAYPPGYYPGKLVQPAQPQQGFSLRRLFGVPDEPPPPARQPVAKPRKPAAPPPAVAKQEKPKASPTTHIVVFGDALAEFARQGLGDLVADDESTEVVSKVRPETSLVRSDPSDWPNFIKAALDAGQKISVAVVMLGLNDRQAIRDGDNTIDVLTDRWAELYHQRVDAILQVFQERNIPVVWIGLPPMKNNKISDDLVAMNEIYRESVQRARGAYVDIWPGFVDEDNRYTANGPDVDGEPAKLRAGDGVSFTKAGARKVAHFADTEIDRILDAGQAGTNAATAPQPGEGAATPSTEAALPNPPEAAPVNVPAKPVAGPVLPLTRPDVTPGGTLVSGPPKLNNNQDPTVQRALRTGIAPGARPGRADDYRWPPS